MPWRRTGSGGLLSVDEVPVCPDVPCDCVLPDVWLDVVAESLPDWVAQPTASAATAANGIRRMTGFMDSSPIGCCTAGCCATNYIYANVFSEGLPSSGRYYFLVERPTRPCRTRPHAGGPCPVPGSLQVHSPPLPGRRAALRPHRRAALGAGRDRRTTGRQGRRARPHPRHPPVDREQPGAAPCRARADRAPAPRARPAGGAAFPEQERPAGPEGRP